MSAAVRCPECGSAGVAVELGRNTGRPARYCETHDVVFAVDLDPEHVVTAPPPDHPIDSADRRERQETADA